MADSVKVGRVLRSSTTSFTVGCQQLMADQDKMTPQLGALLRAAGRNNEIIYGLTCNVTIEDDVFVRQLVAAGEERPDFIEDQRQRRQVPVVVEVMVVGYGDGRSYFHRLPPQPPRTLDIIEMCNGAEVNLFTGQHDWIRLVLNGNPLTADQILVAALRLARDARPTDDERQRYLVGAGRELAKLLALDLARLDGILRGIKN